MKVGGEYFRTYDPVWHCTWCQGVYDATGGPPPANIEQIFPVWNNVDSWNLNALNGVIRSYTIGIGNFSVEPIENRVGAWLQDDWAATRKLTLNLGVRYDMSTGMFAEDVVVQPWLNGHRHADKNNVAPRLGFTYAANRRVVHRRRSDHSRLCSEPCQARWQRYRAEQHLHPPCGQATPTAQVDATCSERDRSSCQHREQSAGA